MDRKVCIGAAVVLVAATVLTAILVPWRKTNETAAQSVSSETTNSGSEQQQDASSVVPGRGDSRERFLREGELALLEVAEPNNRPYNGYLEIQMYDGSLRLDTYKTVLERAQLTPYLTADGQAEVLSTGHTVYVKANESSGQRYIVSGVDVVPVNGDAIDMTLPVILREEGSGERIRTFSSQEALDTARENYERGQAILAGKEPIPENCIILNGSYLPGIEYSVDSSGRTFLPMSQVSAAYEGTSRYNAAEGWLTAATNMRYIMIPNADAPSEVLEYFGAKGQYGAAGTWVYKNEAAPYWTDTFYLPSTKDSEMPIEDVSRIFGWDIYTADGIVSIITDSLDNNANFVLYTPENSTIHIPLGELDDYLANLAGSPNEQNAAE